MRWEKSCGLSSSTQRRGLRHPRSQLLTPLRHGTDVPPRAPRLPSWCACHPLYRPSYATDVSLSPPYPVDDENFKKLVAILRIAVPYTGGWGCGGRVGARELQEAGGHPQLWSSPCPLRMAAVPWCVGGQAMASAGAGHSSSAIFFLASLADGGVLALWRCRHDPVDQGVGGDEEGAAACWHEPGVCGGTAVQRGRRSLFALPSPCPRPIPTPPRPAPADERGQRDGCGGLLTHTACFPPAPPPHPCR